MGGVLLAAGVGGSGGRGRCLASHVLPPPRRRPSALLPLTVTLPGGLLLPAVMGLSIQSLEPTSLAAAGAAAARSAAASKNKHSGRMLASSAPWSRLSGPGLPG